MHRLRIGVVGAGEIFQTRHVMYTNSPLLGTETTWVCDRDPGVGQAVSSLIGPGCKAYADLDSCPLDDVDAVVVAASGDHSAVIEHVLRGRNIPVFSEKPISISLASVERLELNLGDRRSQIFVGYNRLCTPAFVALRNLILADRGGSRSLTLRCILPDDLLYRDQYCVSRPGPEPSMSERLAPERWFEEVVLNLAIHEISILRAIDRRAALKTATRLPAGCIATFESSVAGTVVLHLECLEGPGGGYVESIEFNSAEQRATLSYPSVYLRDRGARLVVRRFSDAGESADLRVDRIDPLEAEWRSFLAFVSGSNAGDNSFDGALADMRMATAIAERCA